MSKISQHPIGVFDSGLGGLAILKYFLRELAQYDYLYLGDNARLPYGEKSPETIYAYTKEAVEYLFRSGCHLIIIACNTASAQALRRLQQEYLPQAWPERRVLGVIRPLAEEVAKKANRGKNQNPIGIIGTKATVNSHAYQMELSKLRPDLKIIEIATPLLVPLIEEGWGKKPETKMILKKYLRPLKEKRVSSLLLACTHYSSLLPEIKHIMPQSTYIPEPGEIIATSLKNYLIRHPELLVSQSKNPQRQYLATDDNNSFHALGEIFLEQTIKQLELVKINQS